MQPSETPELALTDPRRWWGGGELSREVARLDAELAAARAEVNDVVTAAVRQAEELGRCRDTLGRQGLSNAQLRTELDGLRTELASTQHHRDLMCAKAEQAVRERDGWRAEIWPRLIRAGEQQRLQRELEAAQRAVLERDEQLAATRPPGWDSVERLHAAYLELLGRYEAAELVLNAAVAWRAAIHGSDLTLKMQAVVEAVDAATRLPLPDGMAAYVGRLQAELAESRSVADQAQRLASQRQAELANLREQYERHAARALRDAERARQRVQHARDELNDQCQRRLDATAGMHQLAETIGRLTAERMDLDATVARLELLPQRWQDACEECAPRYVDELRAAISGGTAWDELHFADEKES